MKEQEEMERKETKASRNHTTSFSKPSPKAEKSASNMRPFTMDQAHYTRLRIRTIRQVLKEEGNSAL